MMRFAYQCCRMLLMLYFNPVLRASISKNCNSCVIWTKITIFNRKQFRLLLLSIASASVLFMGFKSELSVKSLVSFQIHDVKLNHIFLTLCFTWILNEFNRTVALVNKLLFSIFQKFFAKQLFELNLLSIVSFAFAIRMNRLNIFCKVLELNDAITGFYFVRKNGNLFYCLVYFAEIGNDIY